MGRELQKQAGQEPQIIITMPILEGLDGVQKMSKSLNNYIAIDDCAQEMFGKIMSISDELMWRYIDLLSFKSIDTINTWKKEDLHQSITSSMITLLHERFHIFQRTYPSLFEHFYYYCALVPIPFHLLLISRKWNGDQIQSNAIKYIHTPSNTIKHYQILSNTINCNQIPSNTMNYNPILSNTVDCNQLLSNTMKYIQMLPNL